MQKIFFIGLSLIFLLEICSNKFVKKNSSSPFHCLNSLHNFNKCRRVLDVNHLRFLFQQGGSGHLTKCNILQQIVEELILVQPMLYLGSNHWQ